MSWITTMRTSSAPPFEVCEIIIFQIWQLCKPCQHSHLFTSVLYESIYNDKACEVHRNVSDHNMMLITTSFLFLFSPILKKCFQRSLLNVLIGECDWGLNETGVKYELKSTYRRRTHRISRFEYGNHDNIVFFALYTMVHVQKTMVSILGYHANMNIVIIHKI